jgi:chemotaxis protein methyltransferase CheR
MAEKIFPVNDSYKPIDVNSHHSKASWRVTPMGSQTNPAFEPVSLEISERLFFKFQELIHGEAGIWLSSAKVALLTGRLAKRLRHHGLRSFKEYYALVAESPEERLQMLDLISTNETRFFREPGHFELLEATIFPKWSQDAATARRDRKIRVLSAGCSSGQEPYSLAMVLLHHFPQEAGWEIEIIATDLSTRVLDVARRGIWSAKKADEIPPNFLKHFMLRGFGEQAGKIKAGSEIRSLIQFHRVNLKEASYPFSGKFDLIFCRNVLIYFDQHTREQVVHRLVSFLATDGHFFVGHSESLHHLKGILSSLVPTVYRPAQKSSQAKS